MDENNRDEKIGRAVAGVAWILFAVRFLIIVSVIALPVVYFLGKPLWMAPVAALVVFIVYRLGWRLVLKFIEWTGRQ